MQSLEDLAPYLAIYKQVIPAKVCECLRDQASAMPLHPATIGLHNEINKAYRDTLISIFPEDHWIMGVHFHYGAIANNSRWQYELLGPSPSQLAVYEEGYFYNWHADCPEIPILGEKQTRKITCILNISKPGSYQGGEFSIRLGIDSDDTREFAIPELDIEGTIIVFPSILSHRVSKVLSGRRVSITTWLLGHQFK